MKAAPFFSSIGLVLSLTSVASAADFYVDPVHGAPSNSGSESSPWSSLDKVVADGKFGTTIKAGDTVWLRSGYHGEIKLSGGSYSPAISIKAASGASPLARSLAFSQTSGWLVSGLSVSPAHGPTGSKVPTLVTIDPKSSLIEVSNCTVMSLPDASKWSVSDWMDTASSGISVRGSQVTIRGCTLRNVRFGISVDGERALIDSNLVDTFSADGLRGLGNHGVFQFNTVKNIVVGSDDGDANHDDGFQSWSVGDKGVGTGEVVGVVLRGNTFIDNDNPKLPFRTVMQGIGCFDGYFTDWIIENNVVITNHYHGISMYGMRGGRIVNNTVIDSVAGAPGPAWIMVTAHKDKTPSRDALVRNNLSTALNVSGSNVSQDHNSVIKMSELPSYFVNAAGFDLHLLPNAPAVNAGAAEQSPSADRDGTKRPQGPAVDLGAYEWHEPSLPPADGGTTEPDAGVPDSSMADTGGSSDDAAVSDSSGVDSSAGGDAAALAPSKDDQGCSCRTGSDSRSEGLAGLAGLAWVGLLVGGRRWSRRGAVGSR